MPVELLARAAALTAEGDAALVQGAATRALALYRQANDLRLDAIQVQVEAITASSAATVRMLGVVR